MVDHGYTTTSPLSMHSGTGKPLLALTVIWHPDSARIGDQFLGTTDEGILEVSRFMPLFYQPGERELGLGLGHSTISRNAVRIHRDSDDGIRLQIPISRMVVEINGEQIHTHRHFSVDEVNNGVVIGLGRTILLCLHWMSCLPKLNQIDGFIGVSSVVIAIRDQLHQVAATELPVLLLGESGTGKEVAAQAIHKLGRRSSAAMVAVNMAALNETLATADLFGAVKGAYTGAQTARKGFFAEAANGTLFLDEIGNAPAIVQPMLLRVLEAGDYRPLGAQKDEKSTARIVAATDQYLGSENFNQALLRRLESFVIHIPPLRARREDIGVLIFHIIKNSPTFAGAAAELMASLPFAFVTELACYDWPGNIRQLSQLLKRVALRLQSDKNPKLQDFVDRDQYKSTNTFVPSINIPIAEVEAAPLARKKLSELSEADVLAAMENNSWYIQAAAQELGISRPSMYKLLDTHSQIRRIEQISETEIRHALNSSAGDLVKCAAQLRTPSEALRRRLRTIGKTQLGSVELRGFTMGSGSGK